MKGWPFSQSTRPRGVEATFADMPPLTLLRHLPGPRRRKRISASRRPGCFLTLRAGSSTLARCKGY